MASALSYQATEDEAFKKTWTPEALQTNPKKPVVQISESGYKVLDDEGKVIAQGN
jgi:hypothetical protein